jgi:hypothetical protein
MSIRLMSVLLAGTGMLVGPTLAAEGCSASSPRHRVPLVELYTSEGCSSCPPADRWLSARMPDATAGRLLPLAFHVDYWDYIGWKDPFAQAAFTRRQHDSAAQGGTRTVYTPQVVVDRRDFPGWRNAGAFEASLSSAVRRPPGADLSMELRMDSPLRWKVSLRGKLVDADSSSRAVVFLALFENNLETQVKAGENAGATLRHDYVVRDWLGPFRFGSSGAIAAQADIEIRRDWKPKNLGIAAVAYSTPGGEILQAMALPACHSALN